MKPILFNTDMVQAIQNGKKTVTRRAIKPQPDWFDCGIDGSRNTPMKAADVLTTDWEIKQPYQIGDILYIRETWKIMCARRFDANVDIEYKASGKKRLIFPHGNSQSTNRDDYDSFTGKWWTNGWHPSIHMPKEVARIFLKVTDVRVERLQDITVPNMIKEGIRAFGCEPCLEVNGKCKPQTSEDGFCGAEDQAEDLFSDLWDSTIKKTDLDCYGWDANPWVWVIEFKCCEMP